MIRLIADLAVSFALLGLIEAVVKPVATTWARRRIISWAPVVLEHVDFLLPEVLASKTGAELDQLVRDTFTKLTGDDWSAVDISYFWQLYDPRAAADRLRSKQP